MNVATIITGHLLLSHVSHLNTGHFIYPDTISFAKSIVMLLSYRVNGEGVVLVGDFGLARDVYATDYYRSSANSRLPVKWMPPETLNDGISNEKTDVVSH